MLTSVARQVSREARHRWVAARSARSGLHGLGQPVSDGSLQALDPAAVGDAWLAGPRGHRVEGRVRWVKDRTNGRGADVVIEASGNPAAVGEGLDMVRDAGRYVVVGQYTDAGDVVLVTRQYRLEEAGEALRDMERLAVVKALIRPGRG